MAILHDGIQSKGEECDCAWCSFPLCVGDGYYLDGETDLPYCSLNCQANHVDQMRRRRAGAA